MKLYVYIDGFNLYYGALKGTPYKWLNIHEMCTRLFPNHQIDKIKYFTAPVKLRPNDPDVDKPVRQQIYLRALKTLPHIEILEGSFLTHDVMMRKSDHSGSVRVIKTEEKGTDVKIASHLLHDGHQKRYEMAVLISNDSDLVEPVKMLTKDLSLPVIVVSPFQRNTIELKKVASGIKQIRKGLLITSQFSDKLSDTDGQFQKPSAW